VPAESDEDLDDFRPSSMIDEGDAAMWTLLLWVLVLALIGQILYLISTLEKRKRARIAAEIPAGAKVVAADLAEGYWGGPRKMTLRDREWGLKGVVDEVLETPDGPVPVEVKHVTGGRGTPRRPFDNHRAQLGVYFIVCEADPQIGRQPKRGLIRYVDAAGKTLPHGEFTVANTPEIREWVLGLVREMRQALGTKPDLHRDHHARARCAGCSVGDCCDENLAEAA
jgi:CRISPR/Cas system-associated exonuclease Cas4 (RecB family)